ncbi:hypothetical protein KIW84_066028 [Lathyrus oleraceus]|uniref:Uncharacterized protein n=1 Tax=Pisum sativum TaxID=3888 RepID=A0A9D4WIS1_PEA|nr:hypothetical protein KIW84_066028 [Pisum sativum]
MKNQVSNESSGSSTRFSEGSILCCDSCTDSDVRQGNNRFWNEVDFDVPNWAWKNIEKLDVTGNEDDKRYVKESWFWAKVVGMDRGTGLSSSMSVLINGSPTKDFLVGRGLKQDDPPFLFAIVVDGLPSLVKQAVNIGLFKGFQVTEIISYNLIVDYGKAASKRL